MKILIFSILFSMNVFANQPVDFSQRLSNSFSTVPVGRQQHRIVTVDEKEADINIDEFEQEEKLRQFGCAQGDKKCDSRSDENLKRAGKTNKPYEGEFLGN